MEYTQEITRRATWTTDDLRGQVWSPYKITSVWITLNQILGYLRYHVHYKLFPYLSPLSPQSTSQIVKMPISGLCRVKKSQYCSLAHFLTQLRKKENNLCLRRYFLCSVLAGDVRGNVRGDDKLWQWEWSYQFQSHYYLAPTYCHYNDHCSPSTTFLRSQHQVSFRSPPHQ